MKVSICITTYYRNESLEKCINSINEIKLKKNNKINIIIVDNTPNNNLDKIKKKLVKNSKYKITFLNEKKRGRVFARNIYLQKLKIINPDFFCMFDDDCIVDKYWLLQSIKTINAYKAQVVTGPQLYLNNSKSTMKNTNYSKFFEKNYGKKNICNVKWAASNNVLINYKIIKKNNLFFDKNLNKFGVGEDQLFFLMLSKKGNKIYWNRNMKVYEKFHFQRQNYNWLINRSYRLGILGHYIDQKLYGQLNGFFVNYLKSIYYLIKSLISIILVRRNYFEIILNNFVRFFGRFVGPFIFKNIDF